MISCRAMRRHCSDKGMTPPRGWHRPYLVTPYVWRGRDPAGWDCWGVVDWCRSKHYGRPSHSHANLYIACSPATRGERFALQADLIRRQLVHWHPVERRPGAAILFRIAGQPVHVGLYLGQGSFLHAIAPAGYRPGTPATHLERLDDPVWANRLEGFYDSTA